MEKGRCRLTEIKKNAKEIVELILKEDATFAPLGTGGYAIKQRGGFDEISIITFEELDCSPAREYKVFIKDGHIYAKEMNEWIMGVLCKNGITFVSSPIDYPDFIKEYIKKNNS